MFDAQPEAFGPFRVLDEIGHGRFGPVYKARSEASGELAAVRVFDLELPADQAAALAAALDRLCQLPLDHPAILSPLASAAEGSLVWLAERYVEGTPLDRVMRRDGPQPLADVLLRITQLAGALDFAAAAGVHHGTLHPRDILVSEETTVLTGFGVLEAFGHAGLDVELEGAYIAPRPPGTPVGSRDDVYSLAAITFELVYGEPSPPAGSAGAAMKRLTGVDLAGFRGLMERSLAVDPARRPASALEFASALQAVLVDDRSVAAAIVDAGVDDDDLPLRADERREQVPVFDPEPAPPDPEPVLSMTPGERFAPRPPVSAPASESRSVPMTAAVLAIGLLTGFAAGFVAGQRDGSTTPAPRSAERPVARGDGQGREPADSASAGRTPAASDTASPVGESELRLPPERDGAVRPPPPVEPRGVPRQEPAAPPRAPQMAERAEPPAPREPVRAEPAATSGALQVDSRPRGARVFLDGRLVGLTPLSLPEVVPGEHAVRIDLAGYRRWVTSVTVAAGERARVAASLEQ